METFLEHVRAGFAAVLVSHQNLLLRSTGVTCHHWFSYRCSVVAGTVANAQKFSNFQRGGKEYSIDYWFSMLL